MKTLNCLIIGTDQSGKTSLLYNLTKKEHSKEYKPTVLEFGTQTVEFNSMQNLINYTEIGSGLPSPDFRRRCLMNYDVVFIVFNLMEKDKEELVTDIVKEVCAVRPKVVKILIGTHGDQGRLVSYSYMTELVNSSRINRYIEISNTNGTNIQSVIDNILIPLSFDSSFKPDIPPRDRRNFKICLWGAPGTGKTSFRNTLCGVNDQDSCYVESNTVLHLCGKFWSTMIAELRDGCEEIRMLTLERMNILLICLNLCDKETYEKALLYKIPSNMPVAVMGLHSDQYTGTSKEISTDDIEDMVLRLGAVIYVEGNSTSRSDCLKMIEKILVSTIEKQLVSNSGTQDLS